MVTAPLPVICCVHQGTKRQRTPNASGETDEFDNSLLIQPVSNATPHPPLCLLWYLPFISMTSIAEYLTSVAQLSSEVQFNSIPEGGLSGGTSSNPSKGSLFNLCRNPLWISTSLLSLPLVKPLRSTWRFLQSLCHFSSHSVYVYICACVCEWVHVCVCECVCERESVCVYYVLYIHICIGRL